MWEIVDDDHVSRKIVIQNETGHKVTVNRLLYETVPDDVIADVENRIRLSSDKR